MPPKKTAAAAAPKKASTGPSYQDMIKDAIITLKDRSGSSRPALKKYVIANNKTVKEGAQFDSLFNRALKSGVEKGVFAQPKGPSGGTKLAKKEPKPAVTKPAATKKDAKPAAAKKAAPKKAAPKKPAAAATKKVTAPKKAVAKKPAAKKAAAPKAAPAVVDKPAVLGKTKSGRVTKTTPKTAAKKVTKKPATSKAAVKA